MMMRSLAGLPLLTMTGVLGWLPVPAQAADSGLQPAASAPASQPAALDPAVEKILDRLEKKTIQDIEAELRYIKNDPVLENKQQYDGIVRFIDDKPNPRFFIRFDRMVHDGIISKKDGRLLKEWHVFDGQWYSEARERTETVVRRQIVRPGEKVEVFRIGKGPFPLPFGQKKGDIVQHFSIRLIPPAPKDPPNTDHLECTPLPGTETAEKYGKVHFYVDRKLDLPVRVATVEKEGGNEITASFTNPKVNQGLAGSKLNLPELPGYSITEERLPPPQRPSARGKTH